MSCSVNGIFVGIQKNYGVWESVAVLLNNVWYSSLVEFGFLQLYSTGVKFKIGKAKVYVIEVCGERWCAVNVPVI